MYSFVWRHPCAYPLWFLISTLMLHEWINTYDPANRIVSSCISQRRNTLLQIPGFHPFHLLSQKDPLFSSESTPWIIYRNGSDPTLKYYYLHRPCLATTCLPICEYCSIESTNNRFNNWNSNFLIDLDLLSFGAKNFIECVIIFVILSSDLTESMSTLMVISLLLWLTHSTPLLAIYILLRGRRRHTTLMESLDIIQNIISLIYVRMNSSPTACQT